jgi:hypothetical protein
MAEQIRQILVQEQDDHIDLATALGIEFQTSVAAPRHGPCPSAANAVIVLAVPCLAPIARHLTVTGKKPPVVHAKWIGRCRQRGVKLQHG